MKERIESHVTRWMASAAGVALLLHASPARAQLGFCFGPTIQQILPDPVLTDGVITTDRGWLNAFSYRDYGGTEDANIRLSGSSFFDGNDHRWIALGVEAFNDTQFDRGDAVVILYKIRDQESYGQIVILPLQDDQDPTNIVNPRPGTSKHYTSSDGRSASWTLKGDAPAGWVTWGATATAGGGPCTAASPGTACSWTVEIGIDTSAPGAPSDIERLFVDVVQIVKRSPSESRQRSWPPGYKLVDVEDTTSTPDHESWGNVSVGLTTPCKGVHFGSGDISAAPLDAGGDLKAGVTTTFTVKLHNSGVDAQGVIAHFARAPFGLCGLSESCFISLGSTSTTTSCPNGRPPPDCCSGVAGCIPPDPGGAGTAMQVKWTPSDSDQGHQCIQVRLEATAPNTTFVNQGEFHNMWVAHSSTVTTLPRIDMKQVPPPQGGGNQRIQLVPQTTTQYAFADGAVPDVPVGTLTAQIIQIYRGYRYTGQSVTVGGVRSAVWEPIGSFGFRLQHVMSAQFQAAFEERHAAVIPRRGPVSAGAGSGSGSSRDLAEIRTINASLARATERPAAADWKFQVGDVQGTAPGRAIEIEVPVNGELLVPTTATYATAQPDVCKGGCCHGQVCDKTTPSKVVTLGTVVLVGAVIGRRRRRR